MSDFLLVPTSACLCVCGLSRAVDCGAVRHVCIIEPIVEHIVTPCVGDIIWPIYSLPSPFNRYRWAHRAPGAATALSPGVLSKVELEIPTRSGLFLPAAHCSCDLRPSAPTTGRLNHCAGRRCALRSAGNFSCCSMGIGW